MNAIRHAYLISVYLIIVTLVFEEHKSINFYYIKYKITD
jgi:hypothetical protein